MKTKRFGYTLLVLIFVFASTGVITTVASHTPLPQRVTIAGSLQSELGCPGDWQPECSATYLNYDANDDVWQNNFNVPAGSWAYKAALNDSWDENYGANAAPNGSNIGLTLGAATTVKFYYDHKSHWITDNQNAVIATVPGSFQSALGCSGDWDPGCLRSWLQDPDGDGLYSFSTTAIPAGSYEAKVAHDEDWAENYGAGGVPNGANIPFTVATGEVVNFEYDPTSHVLTITTFLPGLTSVTIAGSLQSQLGCPGDWQPECAATHLGYDAADDVWQGVFSVPAGNWEYKAALDGSWDENYGANATRDGANIHLDLTAVTLVKFYYDDKTHWVTDNFNSVIATVPGSFQSELGCSGDWDPGCLRSWLQDADGDGLYGFSTTALPAGSYEAKVAHNESWDENYGVGGVANGPNLSFTVPYDGAEITFTYDPVNHLLSIQAPLGDNNVEWDGVRHDSRDLLYRTPGGAVPAGTPVMLRLRTFHNDVTTAQVRLYDLNSSNQAFYSMSRAAEDVSCYQEGLESRSCDFWELTLPNEVPNNLWYRFIVTDGSDTDYYADNTPALDGGLGAMSDEVADISYALMVYDPQFTTPAWMQGAVIYQIFADRFHNGNPRNDPQTGDVRYDDPVLALPWNTLPEGYCRNYADAGTNCPWRFDATPPDWSPTIEGPRGRDYFGGDLKGVEQKLPYLRSLGVTAIYFNPIFDAGSNHRYDTADYYQIDPYLGDLRDFDKLVRKANEFGIRIILDGVFNHMSSDSPLFDRYQHYAILGACEDGGSPYRDWFNFRPPSGSEPSPCAPTAPGGSDTYYDGWFGFDSIPVLRKTNPAVQDYFIFDANSVTRYWLDRGTAGWRQDVMGDPSFPSGYWEDFRDVAKQANPDAVIIGELWQKDSTLLRFLRGDRADTTMNYRLRDAVLGLLSPGNFDSKGFADSGRPITPSEFAARLESIGEDYPAAVYYSLMNLLGSHDTERLQWALTPGAETTAARELDAANVAEGQRRKRIAALIQFTVPGAPTVYYGDEAGVTGDDDPDDRRTYPWVNTGGNPDRDTIRYYTALAALRRAYPVLQNGDLRVLLADDAASTLAYGRKNTAQAAIVAINRGASAQTLTIPVAGYLPDGVRLIGISAADGSSLKAFTVRDGMLSVAVGPLNAVLLVAGKADLAPPAAPGGLRVTGEGDAQVSLAWDAVSGAAGYNLYRSPLSGGGWVKLNTAPLGVTTYSDAGLRNATPYYYIVTAIDKKGNESAPSNQASGLPHLAIGWANLQWPPTLSHTISAVRRTDHVYGQVWIAGATELFGPTEGLTAQLGFGPAGSNPQGNSQWVWVEAVFLGDAGSNDEFLATLLPETSGAFDYLYRYSTTGGRDWLYADLDGPLAAGALPANPGRLTINPSDDSTPPAVPTGLRLVAAPPTGVELAWDAVLGDDTLYGYEVRRSDTSGGPYETISGILRTTGFVDPNVVQGQTYYYVVRAVDTSFNRSPDSAEVAATVQLRPVTVTFNVTVPAQTPVGSTVYIAGTLDRLEGNLPQWDPAGVALTQVDATHWTITLSGLEFTQIEYKYTLGAWEYVEKGANCDELGNRQLTLSYGADGTQVVSDTVLNWRNVSPCGN